MQKQVIHTKAHYYLSLLIAFTLPLGKLTAVFIALLLLNWLLEGDFKNKGQALKQSKLAFVFIGFYILHFLGLIYTANQSSGWFDMEVKMSLFVFPLVYSTRSLTQKQLGKVFYALIAGGILASFIMLSVATYIYFKQDLIKFFYEEFSILIHPSYLSMYLNVASAWLIIQLLNGSFQKRYQVILAAVIVFFFAGINVLLSSKMGMLSMMLMFIIFLVYYVINRRKFLLGIAGILLIIAGIVAVAKYLPDVSRRIQRLVDAVTNSHPDKNETESSAVRLLVWKAANNVIEQHVVLGVGTGDSKDELMKEYEKEGLTGALEHKLNTHSAYYQVFVSLGLIGLLTLLANLFLPFIEAVKNKNSIYIAFLLLILFNFVPEAMLETQAGVIFYAFFNAVICFCGSSVYDEGRINES